MLDAKRNTACGFDSIPVDVLKNDASLSVLHILFNVCTGCIPTSLDKGIINSISKCSTTDPRDPYLIEVSLLVRACTNYIVLF